jgi:hypothetical protein
MVRWAGLGALATEALDSQEAEETMRDLLIDGDN